MKNKKSFIGIGLLTAIASSLCCIAPLLAILAGTAGFATTFSWLEPLRPYLIGLTVLTLGYAWYQQLKPVEKDDCGCDISQPSFFKGKKFLTIITVFAGLMLAFPHYAKTLYPQHKMSENLISDADHVKIVNFAIKGMTCEGCEAHIEHVVGDLEGIFSVESSYQDENTIVKFDPDQTSLNKITEAIQSTNYIVADSKIIK